MREILLSDLVRDVLGPRNGIFEEMKFNPRDEYITGVLAPRNAKPEREPDSENLVVLAAEQGDVAEEDDEYENAVIFSPELNPQSLPHSMGLSFFLVTSKEYPVIRLCVTWARYTKITGEDGNEKGWKREPRAFVSGEIELKSGRQVIFLDNKGNPVDNKSYAEISILIRCKKTEERTFFTGIYLVNEIQTDSEGRAGVEEHIFQPQIRIVTGNGTRMSSYKFKYEYSNEEQQETEFLYRDKPVIARGHLCSAVWKKIDPLRKSEKGLSYNDIPFIWPDGELVKKRFGEEIYNLFVVPDVRSEFVPVFAVQNPDFEWHGSEVPEFEPEKLSEIWEPHEVERALLPLYNGYRNWLEEQKKKANGLSGKEYEIASRLIKKCETALKRIEKGIELLKNDSEVRLCFCFANKAINLQARWNRRNFKWRPFQLAFILMVLESIANPESVDRDVCDLLWIPTGGGKTEAYLAIIAFTLALRRRIALSRSEGDKTGAGVAVITRYTLRLLTIQQFRRALRLITACEYLRVFGFNSAGCIGWRPEKCENKGDFIWGTSKFSAGLWVGGNVTPNRLTGSWNPERNEPIYGAIDILKGKNGDGEPAQVLECPACGAILAFPERGGLKKKSFTLNLVIFSDRELKEKTYKIKNQNTDQGLKIESISVFKHVQKGYYTLKFNIIADEPVTSDLIDRWWTDFSKSKNYIKLIPARASRPGYFIRGYYYKDGNQIKTKEYDFDIFCPEPDCPLHIPWAEGQPAGQICDAIPDNLSPTALVNVAGRREIKSPDGNKFVHIPKPFRLNSPYLSDRIPVPAFTVDSQIYSRCPSLVIATVDKFARLPFEPCAAAMFGNVEYHHCIYGYYREFSPPPEGRNSRDANPHPSPAGRTQKLYVPVEQVDVPELIIQDELHLIEGPLGSLVGLYETVVDCLSTGENKKVKYIASTATVTRAAEQVESIFNRRLLQFPSPCLNIEDRFFIKETLPHPLDHERPGRLYAGICAPGRGPLTPIIRIWARLLQTSYELAKKNKDAADPFWTVTGYFNAIKELAGARAVYWQDIPERLQQIAGSSKRPLIDDDDHLVELSGRTSSLELPVLLDLINTSFSGDPENPGSPDALLTTSMFGTGIDIPRLGVMIVHGQPKTTSSYIQSTGRVGRNNEALVVTFYRSTRPRDMSHYEMFCGYHQSLAKFVEPVTVAPFSSGAIERALGPAMTAILRNIKQGNKKWNLDNTASLMGAKRLNDPVVVKLPEIFEARAQAQPEERRPEVDFCKTRACEKLDRWRELAIKHGQGLRYFEYFSATSPVVLGDPRHVRADLDVVFANVPQSLRDIEETITIKSDGR